jgi:hypothetical protein
MTAENGSPLAEAISGFGKNQRAQPIRASIDGATFGFPSFKSTSKQLGAPDVQWGPGWSKVEKDGMWYMEHTNGSKAVPAVEWRITPRPHDQVSTIKVTNGWGKKFPDGTILVFDRIEGPYRLDPKGNKHKVAPGMHTIGGVKVRIFEATVVRTLDPQGRVNVFDSRGNSTLGTTRGRMGSAPGAAAAGASISGGGGKTDGSGPTDAAGKPLAPGTTVGGGAVDPGKLTSDIQKMTEIARGLIGEIRSGNVDPARLASLQAQLATLPSGILQAAGAAGTMASNGTTVAGTTTTGTTAAGSTSMAPPPPGSAGTGSQVAGANGSGTTVAGSGASASGGGVTPPTAGVDANATKKELAAGTAAKVDPSVIPADLHGKQARFAQLPEAVQQAVAAAFGSDQGAGAFTPDRLIAFTTSGQVSVVDKGVIYLRHQQQVRGAGPGEELAMTMRPGRQPRSAGRAMSPATSTPSVQGGGGSCRPATSHANHSTGTGTIVGASSVSGGGTSSITLLPPGGEMRDVRFGGINGSFTWANLPEPARAAILDALRTGSDGAAKAFASRTGTGWAIPANTKIVIDAGFASFVDGLVMRRGAATPTPAPAAAPVSGGGSSSTGSGSTRPPVSGGVGVGTVSPGAAPPVPTVTNPGGTTGGGVSGGGASSHSHSGGGAHDH